MNIKTWNSEDFVIRARLCLGFVLIILALFMASCMSDADKERQKEFGAFLKCAMSGHLDSDNDGYISDLDKMQASREVIESYKSGGDLTSLFECNPQGGLKKK